MKIGDLVELSAIADNKNQIHKEYKVLVMTSGKHRWFAEGSLELMNERR